LQKEKCGCSVLGMSKTANTTTLGARALRLYLEANGVSVRDFADTAGLSERSLHHWLSGAGLPRIPAAHTIEQQTAGAVKVQLWARKG
jgi:DNA-binding transcriptional regulator YiaG